MLLSVQTNTTKHLNQQGTPVAAGGLAEAIPDAGLPLFVLRPLTRFTARPLPAGQPIRHVVYRSTTRQLNAAKDLAGGGGGHSQLLTPLSRLGLMRRTTSQSAAVWAS